MKNIGKYNGVPCYTCTNVEWKDCYDRGNDNGKQIFIIDGVMVRNNKIVGHYDGQHVKDRYDEQPYFVATATKDDGDVMSFNKHKPQITEVSQTSFTAGNNSAETSEAAVAASYEELVKQDIDFGKYSTVVDQFFALLEA